MALDEDEFAALVAEHDRALRGLAFRVLGDRHAMDDALQDAYVKAFRALPRFERYDEALATLRAFGCESVQGFLFARPLRADEVFEWARRHAASTPALGQATA